MNPESIVLTLTNITTKLRSTFEAFVDPRKGKNKKYTMTDAGLSAFSIFFMQSPSFLEYQRSLEHTHGNNNARTLFGAHDIPSDNQIRTLLDPTAPEAVYPMFSYLFNALNAAGIVAKQKSKVGLLVALDGVEYFSSNTIHCENCSTKQHSNGKTSYHHTAVTPVIVNPDSDKVIPLIPEFVSPQDGAQKQDCELNASKRWLAVHGKDFAKRNTVILGDDLYCHEPFCRNLLDLGLNFILVCKPTSHQTMQEWLEYLENNQSINKFTHNRWTGKRRETDTYRYIESVPLRDGEKSLLTNWCELTTTDNNGKVLYHNTFATSLKFTSADMVVEIIKSGRSRWKIENENNNTLKTKGYHFEHNYGHGKKFLSSLLAILIILAFLVHTVLEWMDDKYQLLRKKVSSRQRLFNDIRVLTSYMCFETWDDLMNFMVNSFNAQANSLKTE